MLTPAAYIEPLLAYLLPGLSLGAAAAFAAPYVRRLALPEPSLPTFASTIPLTMLLPDGQTLASSAGHLSRCIRLHGADLDFCSPGELEAAERSMREFLNSASRSGIHEIRFIHIRRKQAPPHPGNYRSKVVEQLATRLLINAPRHFRDIHFMVLTSTTGKTRQRDLDRAVGDALSKLSMYSPTVLSNPATPTQDETLASVWGYITAPVTCPKPAGDRGPFADAICTDRVELPDGPVEFSNGSRTVYRAAVSFGSLGNTIDPQLTRAIAAIPEEFVLVHHLSLLNPTMLQLRLLSQKRMMQNLNFGGSEIGKQFDEQFNEMSPSHEEPTTLYHYTPILMLDMPSKERIPDAVERIRDITTAMGASLAADHNLTPAYLYMAFPGYNYPTKLKAPPPPRLYRPNTKNLAGLIQLNQPPRGLTKCHWGDGSLIILPTSSNTPYDFVPFIAEGKGMVGHMAVVGSSRSGKTVLLAALLLLAERYGIPRVALDRLLGLYVPTVCSGGTYVTLTPGASDMPKLNPLQIGDGPHFAEFLKNFLGILCREMRDPETLSLPAELSAEIRTATDLISRYIPREKRILRNILPEITNANGLLRKGLARWCADNAQGDLLNAQQDSLSLTGGLTSFDMTALLQDKSLLPVFTSYLFQRVTDMARLNSQGAFFIVDEAAPQLEDPLFVKDMASPILKEGGKLGLAGVFVFQLAKDIMDRNLGPLMAGQCKTWLIFPDNGVEREHYPIRFTDAEWQVVSKTHRALKDMKRPLLIKQPDLEKSVLVDIDMSHLGPHLKLLLSGAAEVNDLNTILAKDPQNGIRRYLEMDA